MLQSLTIRIPPGLLSLLHQAVYRGSAYACLSLLTACLGSLLELGAGATHRLSH